MSNLDKNRKPHSPWQIMVNEKMLATAVSYRDLATATNRTTTPIPYSTIYNWLHSRSGAPNHSSYTQEINRAIATALGIRPSELAVAAEASMPLFANGETPRPVTAIDGLQELREAISESKARSFPRARLINLIDAMIDKRKPAPKNGALPAPLKASGDRRKRSNG